MFYSLIIFVFLLLSRVSSRALSDSFEGSGDDFPQLCQTSEDCKLLDTDCVLGECVFTESVECPKNMHYSECLMKCSKTCQKLNETMSCFELESCVEGCECNDGYLWDKEAGVCVTEEQCEELKLKELTDMETISASCPEFSQYNSCPSKCGPITCETMGNNCDEKGCGPKACTCRPGFVQFSENIADGCILVDECFPAFLPVSTSSDLIEDGSGDTPGELVELQKSHESSSDTCPLNSSLKDCVPLTPVNCYTMNTEAVTAAECGHQRCECNDGYVLADSGEHASCIPVSECSNKSI